MINSNDTAFSTGVDPCLSLSNIVMVSGKSDPTSMSVVLKFSKLIRIDTTAEATMAGSKNGNVICRIAPHLVAPRFNAASSRLGSNFCRRAEITSDAKVVINENWPRMTRIRPGRGPSNHSPVASSNALASELENTRIEMPRITPGMINGRSISM